MAGNMTRKTSHSGTYRFNNLQIEVLPYYLYEVSIYKCRDKEYSLLESKFYKSDKFITPYTKSKTYKDSRIEKDVTLLGAPIEFIEDNRLPLYELFKKKRKNGKVHRSHKGQLY